MVLVAARNGRPWGFEQLWGAYATAVAAYLRVQGVPDPDDLTNEVFFGAFSSIATFAGD